MLQVLFQQCQHPVGSQIQILSLMIQSDEDSYVSDEDYDYENNHMAEFEFDTKLDYFDRVERATGAVSEFSNQDR